MGEYVSFNANPENKKSGDCVIRAISKATEKTWEEVYAGVSLQGYIMRDMPSSNHVWGAYLRNKGFSRRKISDDCPDCYTVKDFCDDHPDGTFILSLNGHVVCVIDGSYFDTWDSGDEIPIYYWERIDG